MTFQKPSQIEREPQLLHVKLGITNRCNCQCLHCAPSSGARLDDELSTEKLLSLIDEIAEADVLVLTLTGGEPTLHKDILKIISRASHNEMLVSMLTNGVAIDERLGKKLAYNGLSSAGISIDGSPEIHDYIRQHQGSFEKAVRAFDIFTKFDVDVTLSMTINRINQNDITFVQELAERLDTTVNFETTYFVGRAEENRQLLDFPSFHYDRDCKSACPGGQFNCYIAPNGDVSPCSVAPVIAGNINSQKLQDIWTNSSVFNDFRSSE
ncbi:radical SAM protein [Candidatus Thorarchaeota archaeon]|nr:MAG: radical SAM protein [Candidatus Thorarchaeota archaeon]